MLVRRVGARLAVVAGLSAGLLGLGAAPALAADDRVKVSVSSSIVAGASAGAANVSVSRREDGCVDLRIGLSIKLSGLEADQVRVAIAVDGDWQLVGVSGGGDGLVAVTPTAPSKPRLCKGKSASLRFRLAFLPGAPAGRATVVAEAYDEDGSVLGRASDTTKVVSTATSSPTRTPSASPTPPPVESPDAGSADTEAPTTQPALAGAADKQDGGGSGVGTVVMVLGVAMVGIGVALLVVLLRRRGREATATGPTGGSGVYQSGSHRPGGHGPSGHGPGDRHHPNYPPATGSNYPPPPGPNYPPPSGPGYPPPPGPGYPPPAGGGDSTVIMPRMPR